MSAAPPMTCAEAEPLLPLVADGAVDPDSDPALFAHLAACPTCQRVVASHDLIGLAIRRVGPAPRQRHPLRWWWPAGLAAAAGLVVASALLLRPPAGDLPLAAPMVAATPAPAPAASVPAAVPPTIPPDVIAVPRSDGTTLYLVRQGEHWIAVDPAQLDGPTGAAGTPAAGVQVRF